MNRRQRCLAGAAVAAIAAGGLSIAVAQAVTPPAGTPDLSLMTLQPADLAPGATVTRSRYVKPSNHVIAEYDRAFGPAATTDGGKLAGVVPGVLLVDSTAEAKRLYKELRLVYTSKLGHAILAAGIVKSAGKLAGVKLKNVHFAKPTSAGVGGQSLLQPISIHVKRRTVAADFVILRSDAVLAIVTVIVLRPHLDPSVVDGLAGTVAAHITTVLAATGSTGSTGTTGSTGATGATG